jgi:hypothetical protein
LGQDLPDIKGEDHFLFFLKSRELFAASSEWMVKVDHSILDQEGR